MSEIKDFDYWSEAVKLSKELLVHDAEDKIINFIDENNMNFNEAMLFGLQLKEALGMPIVTSRLKINFNKKQTFNNIEYWEDVVEADLLDRVTKFGKLTSSSSSLHVWEYRYLYNEEIYRVIGAISGGDPTIEKLKKQTSG